MVVPSTVEWLGRVVDNLRNGNGVSVIRKNGEKIIRIEWLNLFNEPQILSALADVIADKCREKSYTPDAVASIETSGAKYGVATSIALGIPYFSIHKTRKIIFKEEVKMVSESPTEGRKVELYIDKNVASKFQRVLVVDDIRRTSKTIETVIELLRECGCEVEACFVIFDFKFAKHPWPRNIPQKNYHPLFVIEEVYDDGCCVLSGGEALSYITG